MAAVRAWLTERAAASSSGTAGTTAGPVNLVAERARKERAQAVEAEQRVAIKAGALLARDEVERIWSAEIAAVRTRLLGLPQQHADQVHQAAATGGVAAVEVLLVDMIRAVLVEMADPGRSPEEADAS